jgi:hypothetical protein
MDAEDLAESPRFGHMMMQWPGFRRISGLHAGVRHGETGLHSAAGTEGAGLISDKAASGTLHGFLRRPDRLYRAQGRHLTLDEFYPRKAG